MIINNSKIINKINLKPVLESQVNMLYLILLNNKDRPNKTKQSSTDIIYIFNKIII